MLRQPRPLVPFTFPRPPASYLGRILATSPFFCEPFSETSGTTAADASGNGFDGSYVNGVTLNAATFLDGTPAPSFDGSDDLVNSYSSGLASAFDMNEGTFALWVNPDTAFLSGTVGGEPVTLMDNTFTNGVRLFKTLTPNQLLFTRVVGGVGNGVYYTLSSAGWHHLALTWSVTANQIIAYVDGSSVGSAAAPTISSSLGSLRTVFGAVAISGSLNWQGSLKYPTLWSTAQSGSVIAGLASA